MTFKTRNGYSGTESAKRTDSMLARLLVYIVSARQSGEKPTRNGFARFIGRQPSNTFATNMLKMAKGNKYVVEDGERTRDGKVLALGPNAQNTAVAVTLAKMGAFANGEK